MGYSAEVVQRARARLAQAKEDRESENRQHLAEAYAKVPRIREIDMLLRRTMAQAAAVAAAGASDRLLFFAGVPSVPAVSLSAVSHMARARSCGRALFF